MRPLSVLLLVWWLVFAFAGPGHAAPAQPSSGAFTPEIARILALPEERIDSGIAALTFAKEIYPGIDIDAYSARIDELALEARRYIQWHGQYDPDSVIRALNSWYYRVYGVQYDKSPNGRQRQENFFINGLLDSRRGQCITLPMLYMVIAQRLGYPVYAVMAPEHKFVRFVDPLLKEQNIELSGGAGYSSDAEYAFRLNISEQAIRNGAYLRTLTKRQYLGVLLQQNAIVFSKRGNIDKAIIYFEKAREIDPKNVYFAKNLAGLWGYKTMAARSRQLAEIYWLTSRKYEAESQRLGWTNDPDANTRKKK